MNPHQVTSDFEKALCEYTGSRYAVVVTSCTMAVLLALKYHIHADGWISDQRVDMSLPTQVCCPFRTYVSIPQSIIHAGGRPLFRDYPWTGEYDLSPYPVWDSARRFTSGMYRGGQMQCLSFHASKILGDTQGGAIIHDNEEADIWLRKARFDGRTEGVAPKDDQFEMLGYHCYLSPDVSARLLMKLSVLPKHNADLPNDEYPNLSEFEIFK